jgi:carboxypeptidase family protein
MSRSICKTIALAALCAVMWPAGRVYAQGVTTAGMSGVVKDAQGAVIPGASIVAVHEPSGTTYEAVAQADGRFFIPGMRVGGPYKVSVTLAGFNTEERTNLSLTLGVVQDLEFSLKVATISETITVVGTSDPVFSSSHTGAATAVLREELASMPTITGRINDIARLTPQYGGTGTFAGQDNRMNNITVDGSYFNNSFGLGGQPGDRTGVAPISLEAIEQIQVNVAPYDVRQGNFIGAGVNTVTRSGTNTLTASVYRRFRNESFVGTEAAGQAFNPGTFNTYTTGVWAGGPIVKNKLFAFGNFEKTDDTRPLSTFRSNAGNEPVGGNITRVQRSDLSALSSYLSTNFKYDTGPFDNIDKKNPGKPWMLKGDYNLSGANKITFRYNQLDSSTDVYQSSSTSIGLQRGTNTTNFLTFANSNYSILENIKSGIGEWNSVIGNTISNNVKIGYTHQDESRGPIQIFPFVEIDLDQLGYTSFGAEPFTPNNELRYNTFQAQDSLSWFSNKHSFTVGGSVEKYHSDNVFFPGSQSAYTYNSLADFYADANGFLANPNRTVAPVTLRRFQVRYNNIPGQTKPLQPLDVWYTGGYAQDEWRPQPNLTVTAGVRMDVAKFGNTAFDNPAADSLTFRDQDGSPVKYNSGALPEPHPLWSPRVGVNWDLTRDQRTQLRGGTGIFTAKPPYVWISNQIGNTGMLTGFVQSPDPGTTAFPFNPDPNKYKPTSVTGAPAASYELDVTDTGFRFPQVWRTNVGVDRRLPWGLTGTGEFIYNRDVNDPLYINANLPAAQSAYTGVDNRPNWVATTAFPACAGTGNPGGPCVTRLNNAPGNQVTSALVIKNTNKDRSWNVSGSLSKPMSNGFTFRTAYSYGVSRGIVEPGSTASNSWGANEIVTDPNNPALAFSANSPGHRVFVAATYAKSYFDFGQTSVSIFWDAHNNGNTSYVFAGDANHDGNTANDLIYIPRNTSEMNFSAIPATATVRAFTPEEQAAAFEAYIQSDSYLSKHRGEYAERGAVFLPFVKRMDMSLTQDIFHSFSGRKHSGQIRLDIFNFGNLINHDWGVGQRLLNRSILTTPIADAQGRLAYRMQIFSGDLVRTPLQRSAGIADVYTLMLSFRYNFQ